MDIYKDRFLLFYPAMVSKLNSWYRDLILYAFIVLKLMTY
jgi:hypothetical protein